MENISAKDIEAIKTIVSLLSNRNRADDSVQNILGINITENELYRLKMKFIEGLSDTEIDENLKEADEEESLKHYEVVYHFEGSINYIVEAKDEDEAKRIAEDCFANENEQTIVKRIADSYVCDCSEW